MKTASATSPLAEAIELMRDAARGYLDGPAAFAQGAATRMTQPNYDTDVMVSDAAGYGVRLAQAWWGGAFAFADAVSVLSEPPAVAHTFEVRVPKVERPSTVEVDTTTLACHWRFANSTDGVKVSVVPPTMLSPGTETVRLRVTPTALTPCWTVQLLIRPVGSKDPLKVPCALDVTTEVRE